MPDLPDFAVDPEFLARLSVELAPLLAWSLLLLLPVFFCALLPAPLR